MILELLVAAVMVKSEEAWRDFRDSSYPTVTITGGRASSIGMEQEQEQEREQEQEQEQQ